MGKIRIKTLGSEEEKAQKERDKVRRSEKKKRLVHLEGLKGGQKVVDMSAGPIIEEAAPLSPIPDESPKSPKSLRSPKRSRSHGQAYLKVKKLIKPDKFYSIEEAINLVKQTSFSKFDGSVEVHLNTIEKGLRGQVTLPHATGKQTRVAIASDSLIDQVSSGKIDFDILVSEPSMMPKLAKIAKILGPKGLMPNPKNNTISEKPEELAKKFSSGATQYKSESEFPIIHFVIGKVSFPDKNLEENFRALIKAIGPAKIKSVFLKSTMSPSVKVQLDNKVV